MTWLIKRDWRGALVLLAAFVCAGTWAAGHVRSVRDRSEVAKMTANMKTECIGRFLIDVPARTEVTVSGERIAGFDIETTEEDEAAFRKRIGAREAAVGVRRRESDGDGGLVDARDLRVPNMIGRLLVYGRSRGYIMEGDRRVAMESVSVEAHAHINDLSFSLSATESSEHRAKTAEALLARLRVRANGDMPSIPGFCIQHAVFADPLPTHNTEHMSMQVSFSDHPDVGVVLASFPGGIRSSDLLSRYREMDAEADPDELLRISKLRAGNRTINGLAGEEVLERVHELNFATTYGFVWEAQGMQNDPTRPFLSLELHGGQSANPGGKPVDTSLHQDAVLDLWDRISSSIRLRQSDPSPSTPLPEPTGPRRGTLPATGEVYPQPVWWQRHDGVLGLGVRGRMVQPMRKGDRTGHS